ncbi:titin homolog isoform X5 [Haliotis rufescens]|uniref:titin homolog isoform X5 n=1 Tax=Haliotis rufescens TaxID=6454 RepID=UPI00201E7A1F|nr:titin homolog isoform X5 [Haliotis rufescens]
MGRKVNLTHLSQEECEQVLQVIQKDFELRQKEKERLSKIEEVVRKEEDKTSILTQQDEFNKNCCIRCCRTFGYIFNRKQECKMCGYFVCKSCSLYEDKLKGYSCEQCIKERELKLQSCEWFYCHVSQRFKRFGSAKVVRSLYKRKGGSQCKSMLQPTELETIPASGSDSELDSGYDPSQFNSLQQSPVRKRPPLKGVFDAFDDEDPINELPVSSSRSPVSDKPVSRAASLETLLTSTTRDQRLLHFDTKRSRETESVRGKPRKDTRDIYQEAYESARRAEESKFKTKFDQLLAELTRALDEQSPSGISSTFGSTSYGEAMLTFRSRMKELLTGFSQRLQLAYESFDIPHEGESTSLQVRQNVSKMVEGLIGESLDLTSDEAVSDLSSLSDDSGGDQNSFEDQIAQAIVSKILENHRREVSENLDQPDGRYSYGGFSDDVEEHQPSDIVKDFEELRSFVKKTQARPSPVSRDIEEQLSPIDEKPIEKVTLNKDEAAEDFHIRCSSAERVHNAEPPLPDFSEFEHINFDTDEIDPDLLSMNLAIIPEETEEELEDEANDTDKPGRENWIFKGMVSPYDNLGNRRVGNDEGKPLYMMVPQPEDDFVPKVGNRDADQLSDLSDTDAQGQSAEDLSDDENTFYAKTSEELARISRKHSTTSAQTDSDADSGVNSKILTGALRTESGPILGRNNAGVGTTPQGTTSKADPEPLKLTEEFVPAEGDDPTFILPPESVSIAEGEPLKISCRVGGTSAIDSNVFWYREDKEVEELEDSEDIEVTNDGDKHTITLFNLTKEKAGQYMCIALSDQGKCTQYFIVTITDNKQELKKPEFIKDIKDVEVKEGQSVKFRCKVKGYPQPRVIWYKDGKLLKNSKFCRLEKFGNRDYILTIDNATLDDDAEYTVVAKNIAGNTKSTAEVIVESDQLDSIRPTEKQTVSSTPSFQQRRNDQNLTNLSDKVLTARSDITSTAERMLGTAEELSFLNENLDIMDQELTTLEGKIDEENNNLSLDDRLGDTSGLEAIEEYRAREKAAKNVRMLTSSALNVLRTAEEIIQNERETPSDDFMTSTPRDGDMLKTDTRNNNTNDDMSTASTDSFLFLNSYDDSGKNNGATSNDTQDVSDQRNQFKNVKEFSFGETESDMSDFLGRKYDLSSGRRQRALSPTSVRFNLPDEPHDRSNEDAKEEKVNCGPKDVDDSRYGRDYELKSGGKKKWEVKTDFYSPQAEIVNRKETVENAEEQIYMAAGKVYSLEDRVRDLESRVTSGKGQMSELEDEVAKAVAQVAQSERQVGTIEQTVNRLHESSESSLSPRADSQLSSPRLSIDSGVSSIRERPPPTVLVGHTCEDEVPESRGEFDADSGIELPSVHRLRAMFSKPKEEDFGDGTFQRPESADVIHSITARHVPKEQLERLRRTELGSSVPAQLDDCNYSPDQSLFETSSSSMNFTFEAPKRETHKANKIVSPPSTSHSARSPDLSLPATYKDLEPGKEPVLIFPEPSPSSQNISHSTISMTTQSQLPVSASSFTSDSASPRASASPRTGARSATPVPQRADHEQELVVLRATSPGPDTSATERPKTPKIRSGAISARAAFWEKRILFGSTSDETVSEDFPEMVQEADC